MRPDEFLHIDFPAMLAAILTAVLCSLPGNFLILRKQAMLTDALSHSVLPGLALAYLITDQMGSLVMMTGALISCLVSAGLIYSLERYAQMKSDQALGIVFTTFFALGIFILEKYVGGRVHLDAHHALYGGLELIYWQAPLNWNTLPSQIKTMIALLAIGSIIFYALFKEFRLTSFDAVFARTQGLPSSVLSLLLMIITILTAVACFEAVGLILVISLFVCPPATARLLSDNLQTQIYLSIGIGALSAVTGYILAVFIPLLLGHEHSLSAGGMIALTAGGYMTLTVIYKAYYSYSK